MPSAATSSSTPSPSVSTVTLPETSPSCDVAGPEIPSKFTGRRKKTFQNEILKKMDSMEARIENQHREMMQLSEELLDTDKKNSDLFEELVKSNIAMNNAFTEYLKKSNK